VELRQARAAALICKSDSNPYLFRLHAGRAERWSWRSGKSNATSCMSWKVPASQMEASRVKVRGARSNEAAKRNHGGQFCLHFPERPSSSLRSRGLRSSSSLGLVGLVFVNPNSSNFIRVCRVLACSSCYPGPLGLPCGLFLQHSLSNSEDFPLPDLNSSYNHGDRKESKHFIPSSHFNRTTQQSTSSTTSTKAIDPCCYTQ